MKDLNIDVIELVKRGMIHFSEDEDEFFIGHYGGMGSFDVRRLPQTLSSSLRELLHSEGAYTTKSPFTAPCVGTFLREDSDDFQGYWVKLEKIKLSE